MAKRKSPLRDRPLRSPGQSIQERIDYLVDEKIGFHLLICVVIVWLAIYEWIRYWSKTPLTPWLNTGIAIVVCAWVAPKILTSRKELRRLRQGRDGERIVAEILDRLRQDGAAVFHDVQAGTFNVDHVIASKKGIFVIETKTYSKRQGSKVVFDGTTLSVDGFVPSRNPVEQARAISNWIRKSLREGTAKDFYVRPVVVFPGWFVNPIREQGGSDVWVLNPEALPTFVQNEKKELEEQDFRAAVFHLSRIARSA